MVKEEEKVIFVSELDKLHDEYRKCKDFSMRLRIEEDIALLKKAIILSGNNPDRLLNKIPKNPRT